MLTIIAALASGAWASPPSTEALLTRLVSEAATDFVGIQGPLDPEQSIDGHPVHVATVGWEGGPCHVEREAGLPTTVRCTVLGGLPRSGPRDKPFMDRKAVLAGWAGDGWSASESTFALPGDNTGYRFVLRQAPEGLSVRLEVNTVGPNAFAASLIFSQRPGFVAQPAASAPTEPPQVGACRGGDASACRTLAAAALDRGALAEGEDWLRRACIGRDGSSCGVLGELLLQGGPGVTANPPDAARALATGCDLADAGSCLRLGQALEEGWGVEANAPEALAAFTKAGKLLERDAAAGDPVAVFRLGWMVEHGKGTPANAAIAADLYGKACAAGLPAACAATGRPP